MFTQEHFIWIGICAVFIGALSVISVKCRFSFKTSALIMTGIALCSEVSKILSHMEPVSSKDPLEGMVIEATALPLHLCSIMIFAFFWLPFGKNEKLREYIKSLVVPIAIIGGTLAILLATSGTDFAKPEPYQCFIYHAGILWFAIYLIATKQVKLGVKPWLVNILSVLCMAVCMLWVNGALQTYDTNFFYVVRPPMEGLPLLNLDNGWYCYFATLIAVGFVLLSAVHLPFIIAELSKKKR